MAGSSTVADTAQGARAGLLLPGPGPSVPRQQQARSAPRGGWCGQLTVRLVGCEVAVILCQREVSYSFKQTRM